jgi:hypothetical protein
MMIYICHNSLTKLTVRIEADRMRRCGCSEWHFYKRIPGLFWDRWVMVGKVENSSFLSITTEDYASDHDFLKQAGVRL